MDAEIAGYISDEFDQPLISVPSKEQKLAIPKQIMQTWKTHSLPEKWIPSQQAIQKYMPDWDYRLMSDQDNRAFVEEHFPDFISTYDNFAYPIQRADAIRYCWLYIYGGIYMDCDVELLAPIDSFFAENTGTSLFLVDSANVPGVITNSFMASAPGHPLWLAMIEEMKRPPGLSSLERHLLVMNTTGPMALNRVVKRLQPKYTLLSASQFNPYTICDSCYNSPDAIMRPLPGSSWVGGAAALYHWCYCKAPVLIAIVATILLILAIGIAIRFDVFPH